MNVYCALVHHPVYNKNRDVITTSISTSSIHDISRTAKTYALKALFIVTPIIKQHEMIKTIIMHWKTGYGAEYNPTRRTALDIIRICSTLEECIEEIEDSDGQSPNIVVTCARNDEGIASFSEIRSIMSSGDSSWLILFGTGWGLTEEVLRMADKRLEPIRGPHEYNHLSVRAAIAITLDRLFGPG